MTQSYGDLLFGTPCIQSRHIISRDMHDMEDFHARHISQTAISGFMARPYCIALYRPTNWICTTFKSLYTLFYNVHA